MPRMGKFIFSFVLFVILCYGGLVWFVNHEVEKGFNEAVAGVNGLTVAYDDLWVDIYDQTVTLTGAKAILPEGQKVSADELVIYAYDQLHATPYFIKGKATGVKLAPTEILGPWALSARVLGTEALSGDMFVDYIYNDATQTLDLKSLSFDDEKLGTIELSGAITELDLDTFRVENLVGLRIKDAELTFTDKALMQSVMEQTAKAMNMSEQAARDQICGELTSMAEFAGKDGNEVAEKALRGMKRFMAQPGTITLSARPAEPVPYLYFFMGRDVYENLRMINLSVETDSGDDI